MEWHVIGDHNLGYFSWVNTWAPPKFAYADKLYLRAYETPTLFMASPFIDIC